jgi:3-deoxy-D-manno-octulosonate 8-phosphate phosphatase (KDO 8-P phosphatase)
MKAEALAERCRRLRLLLSDVDGVMTDGRVLLLPDGREVTAFHIRDGLGVLLARRAGLRVGILSGRSSDTVARRAADLGMEPVVQGVTDKCAALDEILVREGLAAHQVAYVGDDLNDLAVMARVGLAAAPADAAAEVRQQALLLTEARGGHGCLRELVEALLRARGEWEETLARLASPAP